MHLGGPSVTTWVRGMQDESKSEKGDVAMASETEVTDFEDWGRGHAHRHTDSFHRTGKDKATDCLLKLPDEQPCCDLGCQTSRNLREYICGILYH